MENVNTGELTAFEQAVMANLQNEGTVLDESYPTSERAMAEAIKVSLQVSDEIKKDAFFCDDIEVITKPDGTPVSVIDQNTEKILKAHFNRVLPSINVVGEELKGEMDPEGDNVAIDPIDGTFDYLTGFPNYTIVNTGFKKLAPEWATVFEPGTGILTYAIGDQPTRRLQCETGSKPGLKYGRNLPLNPEQNPKLRVRLPIASAKNSPLHKILFEAHRAGDFDYLRSPGGSTGLNFAAVAMGREVLVQPWMSHPAGPEDLAVGIKLIQNSGGDVIDLEGNTIKAIGHHGIMLAGTDMEAVETIRQIILSRLEEFSS